MIAKHLLIAYCICVGFVGLHPHQHSPASAACVHLQLLLLRLFVHQGMEGAAADLQELLDKEVSQASFRW